AYFNAHQQEELTQDKNNLVFENKDHVIFKVLGYTYFPYYIMVSQVNKLSYPFSLLTIEQVVSVLSFALYKNTKIQEVEKNDINRFFESLVYNKSDQALSIKKHADLLRQYYIYPSDYYQTIICGIDAKTNLENSYYLNELHQLTFQWLTDKLSEIDSYISVYRLPSNDRFVILIQNKQEDHLEMIERLQISYNDYFEDQISFGIGNEVTEFSQLPSSFFEASEAFENGLFNNEKSFISQYHSKDIQELLQLIPQEKLLPFVKHTLGPLSYPKTKKDIELKQTLKIYMDNQCDITKTAEKIFIHRNT
ncbi:PucR family transcriptional regulator, partial [Mammaliicoccus sciuri]